MVLSTSEFQRRVNMSKGLNRGEAFSLFSVQGMPFDMPLFWPVMSPLSLEMERGF